MQAVPEELPDYAWATSEPATVGLTTGPWAHRLPAIVHRAEAHVLPDALRLTRPHWCRSPTRGSGFWARIGTRVAVRFPGAWLRPVAMHHLLGALQALPAPFGLAVFDAWRDPRLQAVLHDRVYQDSSLAPGFVAYPDPDPRRCPPHASGRRSTSRSPGTGTHWPWEPASTHSSRRPPPMRWSRTGWHSNAICGGCWPHHGRRGFRPASPGVVALGVRHALLGRGHRATGAVRSRPGT